MDINTVTLSGRIYDIGSSPTKGVYPVVEAKLSVNIGNSRDNGKRCEYTVFFGL